MSATHTATSTDPEVMAKTLDLLLQPGQVTELRALGAKGFGYRPVTLSGYFDDPAKLVAAAKDITAVGVYITPNPLKPETLTRAINRVRVVGQDDSTKDGDVQRLHRLLIDFDPVLPTSGISSTDVEHAAAIDRAGEVRAWLTAKGWPAPILADSGNGAHLVYRIDLPPDRKDLPKRCLEALASWFQDATVKVDRTTFNPARIWKLYGTLACKGDSTPNRPHRLARPIETPDQLKVVPQNLLDALAAMIPVAVSEPRRNGATAFEIERWITDHEQTVTGPTPWGDGRKWIYGICPFNPDHTNRSAGIFQLPSGAIAFRCHHDGCAGKDWYALRDLVEPGWRDRVPLINGDLRRPTAPQIHSVAYREVVPTERILRFTTGAELATGEEPVAEPIAAPLAFKGAIVELDGKIKWSGKTTLLLHAVAAVLDGENFLGHRTLKTPVVYLTEQNTTTFKLAMKRAGLLGREDIHIMFWRETVGVPWPVIAKQAADECKRIGAWWLVTDTLPQFAGLKKDDENDSGDALAAMQPLQLAAADGLAVTVVRHERKSGGDVGDSGRGSTGYGGAVDVILRLRRPEGNARKTLRVIDALPREGFDVPEEMMVELTEEGYESLGDPQALAVNDAIDAILKMAPVTEDEAVRLDALLEKAKAKHTTGHEAVEKLLADGRLARRGEGVKGSPFQFWRPPIHSVGTPSPNSDRMNSGGKVNGERPLPPPRHGELPQTSASGSSETKEVTV